MFTLCEKSYYNTQKIRVDLITLSHDLIKPTEISVLREKIPTGLEIYQTQSETLLQKRRNCTLVAIIGWQNEVFGQTVRKPKLILVFAGRLFSVLVLSYLDALCLS